MPLIPDNDRFWASLGATWQVFRGLHFDLAYSHIWVKDPSINISAGFRQSVVYSGGTLLMSEAQMRTSTFCRARSSSAGMSRRRHRRELD